MSKTRWILIPEILKDRCLVITKLCKTLKRCIDDSGLFFFVQCKNFSNVVVLPLRTDSVINITTQITESVKRNICFV